MWCSYSNVVIPKHATPCYKAVVPSVSASSLPRHRRRQDVSKNHHHQVGELGQTLVANIQSNPTPISKPQQEEEGEQISGSDILWALQRAGARKNMKMVKNKKNQEEQRRGSSSVAIRMEECGAVDYTNVRPLCINSHWAPKLDELEKRLRELSDTI